MHAVTVPGEEHDRGGAAPEHLGRYGAAGDVPDGSAPRLPFFVYGTLRPGGRYHDAYLRGHLLAEDRAYGELESIDVTGYPQTRRSGDERCERGICPEHVDYRSSIRVEIEQLPARLDG